MILRHNLACHKHMHQRRILLLNLSHRHHQQNLRLCDLRHCQRVGPLLSHMLTATMTRIYHFGLRPFNSLRGASGWRQDLSIKPRSANPPTRLELTIFVKRPVVNAMTAVKIHLERLQLMMTFAIAYGSPFGHNFKRIFVSRVAPRFRSVQKHVTLAMVKVNRGILLQHHLRWVVVVAMTQSSRRFL